MIDKEKFIAGMAVLSGAFGREVDGPVQRAYYGVLNSQLTDEEFERAVSLTLATETFWPSPAVLLSKVKADDDTRGQVAFEHVNRVSGNAGGFRFLSHETYHREFDAPTRAAISAVGGLSEIGNTPVERWPTLQRKFAKAYSESLVPKLAPPETDGRVKQLVRSVLSGRDRAAGVAADD
jgi:hypothetical protein